MTLIQHILDDWLKTIGLNDINMDEITTLSIECENQDQIFLEIIQDLLLIYVIRPIHTLQATYFKNALTHCKDYQSLNTPIYCGYINEKSSLFFGTKHTADELNTPFIHTVIEKLITLHDESDQS